MSTRLTVEIDPGPLERTRADVAVFHFFDSDRPLQSGAGRVDWRLCGQLSRLLVAGKLSGASGEAVLLQTGGGLAAPLAIGLGLGARNAFDAEACIALGADAARRALYLGARTLALPLPDPHVGDLELSDRIDALVFSGGIGENSMVVRERVLAQMSLLGMRIDPARNAVHGTPDRGRISSDDSLVPVFVIPTNEEAMIARETVATLGI